MTRNPLRLAAAALLLAAFATRPAETAPGARVCERDLDCADGLYCDGVERCRPGAPGADGRGCLPADRLPCAAGLVCDEAGRRCFTPDCANADKDGDGHRALDCPGGDDCDDADPRRHPGRIEVCDAAGFDEDCDPRTVGNKDDDHDGEMDTTCFNEVPARQAAVVFGGRLPSTQDPKALVRVFGDGQDCDDHNPAIRARSQQCTATGLRVCRLTPQLIVGGRARRNPLRPLFELLDTACGAGQSCVRQPGGQDLCMATR